MKKQITPTIKAHLLRSALYLLLLVAVCAIPFALAQRNAAKRSLAKPVAMANVAANTEDLPRATGPVTLPDAASGIVPSGHTGAPQLAPQVVTLSSGTTGANPVRTLRMPLYPNVILYDQYDNATTNPPVDITSQDFETSFDQYDDQTADDFVVPSGQTWNVSEVDVMGELTGSGPVASFNVYFYQDSGGLPGTLVASAPLSSYTGGPPDFVITLTSPVTLTEGTYWVSVQAREDFTCCGQWYWHNRDVQSNQGAAWQNPGNGFGTGCTTWVRKTACSALGQLAPDQVYRLNGTIGGGTPTPTPTGSPTPTPTATPTPTGTPGGCQFRVLIAYADIGGQPTMIQIEILAEPGVIGVDLFDAFSSTPTLQQLQQYNIVYAFSNNGWFDAVAMGNVLAD